MSNLQRSANPISKNGFLRYQLILIILLPVLIVYTLILSLKFRSLTYFLQRLGIFSQPSKTIDIWIHAASVGEVNAAIPLITAIREKHPNKSILVTTVTPTGATLFKNKLITNTLHAYLPIDYPRLILSLIQHYRPKCALIMETEIWPNLFRTCYRSHIPLCTVNGRLSRKTLDTKGWIRSLYRSTLQYSSRILTRSDNDTKSYIALGADPDKVKTIGNIKFSVDLATPEQTLNKIHRHYILAASTHADEERLIATLWKERNFKQLTGNKLLIIAPRHPNRLNDILGQLNRTKLDIAIRSREDKITDNTDIYIADTVGELTGFMANADIVFMGGSLVPVGGHNVIEPAALGKVIVFGPYMENFENEAELLLSFNAAIQVESIDQLGDALADALRNPDKYAKMAQNAKQIIEQQQDTANRYVESLDEFIRPIQK